MEKNAEKHATWTCCAYIFWVSVYRLQNNAHLMRLKRFQVCGEQAITIVQLWIESCSKQTTMRKRQENGKLAASTYSLLTTHCYYKAKTSHRMHANARENFLMIFWQYPSCVCAMLLCCCRNRRLCFCFSIRRCFRLFFLSILFLCVSAELEINPPLQNQ